ncbi:hypothetical protein [Streptomyces sp. SS]|uniref:hypothetical protein n=1 Tax=Streptomyces sp. SS TaxID=260742 RepID=UPI00030DA6CA|nr:hypothetical protein [Streptomyces sp. SS]
MSRRERGPDDAAGQERSAEDREQALMDSIGVEELDDMLDQGYASPGRPPAVETEEEASAEADERPTGKPEAGERPTGKAEQGGSGGRTPLEPPD